MSVRAPESSARWMISVESSASKPNEETFTPSARQRESAIANTNAKRGRLMKNCLNMAIVYQKKRFTAATLPP